jgi:hypothetical protein
MRAVRLLGMVGFVVGLAGCEGKQRNFVKPAGEDATIGVNGLRPDGTAGKGSSQAAEAVDPNLALAPGVAGALGAACESNVECNAPATCVDGVCCSSACTEVCAACNLPGSLGTCSAAPSDALCAALNCAGQTTDCRIVDTSQLALNCESFGVCRSIAECAKVPRPEGTACQGDTGTCDGEGVCRVAGKLSLGETCAADADCAEAHCVEGGLNAARVCCDTACDGLCQGCSAAGHCEEMPASDAACEAVACPPDNVCRDFVNVMTGNLCRGFGQCQTAQDCPATELRPGAECSCDATNTCLLNAGAACDTNAECGSGACMRTAEGASVCCKNPCGAGLFCSTNGAACVGCEGSAITCEGNDELRCNAGTAERTACPNGCNPGVGCNVEPPVGFACDDGTCATPGVCQTDVTGQARCCSRDCAAENKVCGESGSCDCVPGQIAAGEDCLKQAGDPCTATAECQTGASCTDGVCCQEACNGACERCEANTGACIAVAQAQQDNQCTNGRQCTGTRGDCRLTLRQQCSGDGSSCISGNCEATVGNATQICCAQDCTGNQPFCRSDGSGCTQCESNANCGNGCDLTRGVCNALLPIGNACGSSAQCASNGQCLLDQNNQTRCCERNCTALGQVCNTSGRCIAQAPAVLVTAAAPMPFPRTLVGGVAAVQQTWTVRNTGDVPTAALIPSDNPEFPMSGSCLRQPLPGGSTCAISISFVPRNAGSPTATLSLSAGANGAILASVPVSGASVLANGQPCPGNPALCDSGRCTEWLADPDGDSIGSFENVGGFPEREICGDASPANRPPDFVVPAGCRGNDVLIPYVPRSNDPLNRPDCCDIYYGCSGGFGQGTEFSSTYFPGQTAGTAAQVAAGLVAEPFGGATCALSRDRNCDGKEVIVSATDSQGAVSIEGRFESPPCAGAATAADCDARTGKSTGAPTCGLVTLQACTFSAAGVCSQTNSGQISVLCL